MFVGDVVDAIKYPFRDFSVILVIGLLLFIINLLNELSVHRIILFIVFECLICIELGYGSKIVYCSLKGYNKPPKLNRLDALFFEGFKKSLIYFIYGIFLTFTVSKCRFYFNINIGISVIYALIFLFIYMLLIGGLLNRYCCDGSFFEAFNVGGAYNVLSDIGLGDIVRIFVCAQISQFFVVSVFFTAPELFSVSGALFLLFQFFISPFTLFTTKRMISLSLRNI